MRKQTWLSGYKVQGESNSGVSQTQPDMAMSLAELLKRHTQGREIPTFDVQYEGDEFFPDPRTLDLADIHEMATRNAEHIQGLRSSLQAESGAKPAGRKSAVASKSEQGNGRIGDAASAEGEASSSSGTQPVGANG